MKRILLILAVLPLFAVAQNGRLVMPNLPGYAYSSVTTTFANSQKDTVIYYREPGVSAITFSVHAKDSVATHIDSGCVIMRWYDGTMLEKIAGDTLAFSAKVSTNDGNTGSTSIQNGTVYAGNLTMAPYADRYVFIVRYAAAGNGVTTPNVTYKVSKLYSK